MKFSCSKDSLESAILFVQKAVKTNTTVPILDGILIQAENNAVKLTGYDLETGIEADVNADVYGDGSIVVNSRLFGDLIKEISDDTVTLSTNDRNALIVECDSGSMEIKGNSAENYPKIPTIENAVKIIVPQAMLKKMISRTIFAVSKDDSRQSLTGCFLESDGETISMVAIDGFRMALRRTSAGKDFPKMSYIIPGKALSESAKIFDDKNDDDEVIIYSSENHLLFDVGHVRIVSRLIKGSFVAYNSLIQKNPKSVINVNKEDFFNAVRGVAPIIQNDDRRCPVRLSYNEGSSCLVVSASSEYGKSERNVPATITGEPVDIDFNIRYILDVLKNIDDESINIEFNGVMGPCIFSPVEGNEFIYLILPIRR